MYPVWWTAQSTEQWERMSQSSMSWIFPGLSSLRSLCKISQRTWSLGRRIDREGREAEQLQSSWRKLPQCAYSVIAVISDPLLQSLQSWIRANLPGTVGKLPENPLKWPSCLSDVLCSLKELVSCLRFRKKGDLVIMLYLAVSLFGTGNSWCSPRWASAWPSHTVVVWCHFF